jgi:galactose mutarotase-like enzyme
MSTPIRIASAALSAEISPIGAELQRLTASDGRELLWDGDPAFWSGRAPILFPIVGTVSDDHYRCGGQSYALPRHGFARRRTFSLIEHRSDSATLRLESDDQTRALWPFAFCLDMIFAIDGRRLMMTGRVINRSDRPMPTSFGFHPALRWPLPDGGERADHVILFDQAEPGAVRRLDSAGLLDPAPRPSPVDGNRLALSDDLFVEDALIFESMASRRLVYGVPGARQIAVDYPGMPSLGLWTKPGAGYLCIEPWQGYSDPAGFEGDITDKPGAVPIAPGATRDFMMGITPLD